MFLYSVLIYNGLIFPCLALQEVSWNGKWCGLSSRLMCFIIFLRSVIISFSSASQPSVLLSSAARFPYLSSSSSVSLPLPFPFGASRMADLHPGTRILALYSSEAGECWNERIILSRAYDSHFSMIGPDLIVYFRCVGGTQDIRECFFSARRWHPVLEGCRMELGSTASLISLTSLVWQGRRLFVMDRQCSGLSWNSQA